MITDLLLAGLLLASSTDLMPGSGIAPAPAGPRTDAATCATGTRPAATSALLEAHAAYAALPPFSLARLPNSPAKGSATDKAGAECKS